MAFTQEVGNPPNCEAGSLSYSFADVTQQSDVNREVGLLTTSNRMSRKPPHLAAYGTT